MATPREELEELRALARLQDQPLAPPIGIDQIQEPAITPVITGPPREGAVAEPPIPLSPREELEQLRALAQEAPQEIVDTGAEAEQFPEIGDAPELNELTLPAFASSLGLLFAGDVEGAKGVLKTQFPEATFSRSQEGEELVTLPSGTFRVRGLAQQIASIGAQALSFVGPGAFASGVTKGAQLGLKGAAALQAGAAGVTQAGIETAEAVTGGEFDKGNIAIAAGLAGGGTLAFVPMLNRFKARSETKRIIADKIQSGDTTSDVARFMATGSGKVAKDKEAIEAIRQGFDEAVVSMTKGASKADKTKMIKMTETLKKAKKDAKFAALNRPTDTVGDTVMSRVNHIRKVNKRAGKNLDVVAKELKGQDIDFSGAVQKFTDDLADMGIAVNDDLTLSFKGSDIEGLAGPQNALNNLMRRMTTGEAGAIPDAHDVHRMKRFIDETVTFGKQAEGLAGRTESIMKALRHNLDSALDQQFPKYNTINTQYADTIRALDSIQDLAGKKLDLAGPGAEKQVGTLMRRILGNAQSRTNVINTVDELDEIAKRYEGQFEDDVIAQILYADELDNVFRPVARTSFRGEIGREVERGVAAVAGIGPAQVAAKGAGALINRVHGINEDAAFQAIEKILARQ